MVGQLCPVGRPLLSPSPLGERPRPAVILTTWGGGGGPALLSPSPLIGRQFGGNMQRPLPGCRLGIAGGGEGVATDTCGESPEICNCTGCPSCHLPLNSVYLSAWFLVLERHSGGAVGILRLQVSGMYQT